MKHVTIPHSLTRADNTPPTAVRVVNSAMCGESNLWVDVDDLCVISNGQLALYPTATVWPTRGRSDVHRVEITVTNAVSPSEAVSDTDFFPGVAVGMSLSDFHGLANHRDNTVGFRNTGLDLSAIPVTALTVNGEHMTTSRLERIATTITDDLKEL